MVGRFIGNLRVFLALSACLLSVFTLYAGLDLLWDWFAIRGGETVYVGSEMKDYLYRGGQLTLAAVFAGLLAVSSLRRNSRVGMLTAACILSFFGAGMSILVRNWAGPANRANVEVMGTLSELNDSLIDWAEHHGHYPASEGEFLSAVERVGITSPFNQGGVPQHYKLVYVGDAGGPMLNKEALTEPGVVYCAFRSDLRRSWLTATVLEKRANGPVVWAAFAGETIIHGSSVPPQWYRPPQ